jgi:FlaA1/EpsC-like NDP-sugar epimerase
MPTSPAQNHAAAGIAGRLLQLLMEYRRLAVVAIHLPLIAVSNYVALWLRFDGVVPQAIAAQARDLLPALVLVRAATFIPFRLYEGLWRYTSLRDARNIVAAVVTSSVIFFVIVWGGWGTYGYPRSVYIIDAVLLIGLISGVRSIRRLVRELNRAEHNRRVLIYGAGDAGEMIVRDMTRRGHYQGEPVGFVDDDRRKVGQRIHGVPVLGTRMEIATIVKRVRPDDVLIAMPGADAATIRGIVKSLEPYKLAIKTLPNLRDVLDGKVSVSEIRELKIEDLLQRAPIGLDPAPVRDLIAGKSVLVTGAGGSIGSELCRQILSFGPRALILFERYENSLFAIENELRDRGVPCDIQALVGDMTDRRRVDAVFAEHLPEIVFHAAAHKHVPLMEASPCEAVKNNVGGTWALARAAVAHGASRFVMISTDKAVNPTSVMGTSKRVCEMIVQGIANGGYANGTKFSVVRFGNVLGSNGSVVPRFVDQIKAGGPVTVTHPEVRRFFMLIPEAVELVLHAATLGQAGEVMVLDMGEQIKVLEVARNLIRLSGYVPGEDIQIVFTGLRPGEKLYEELQGVAEDSEPSSVDKITRIRRKSVDDWPTVEQQILALIRRARRGDTARTLGALREIVPTYEPPAEVVQATASDPTIPAADHQVRTRQELFGLTADIDSE